MLIDFHTHAYPPKVADYMLSRYRAEESYAAFRPEKEPDLGSVDSLLDRMRQLRIDRCVVLPVATKPYQVRKLNEWADSLRLRHNEFAVFGTLHPLDPDLETEVNWLADRGFAGVKVHPNFQLGAVTSPMLEKCMVNIYEMLNERKMILFACTYMPEEIRQNQALTATHLCSIAERYSQMPVVAAHLAGMMNFSAAMRAVAGAPLYVDLSSSLHLVPKADLLDFIERHGTDRVLFGTDTPYMSQEEVLKWFDQLGLPAEPRRLIAGENARRLLRLT